MAPEDADPRPPEKGASAEQELTYRLHQQQLTAAFGAFALRCADLDELLQEATRVGAEGLHTPYCKALEYLPDEKLLLVRAGVGWNEGVVGSARMGTDVESPAGFAFKTGLPVISNHLDIEKRFRTPTLLADHGIKRAINVIIRGDGEPFGVLEVDSRSEGRFTEHDLAFLQGFANLMGLAIDRQRAQETIARNENLLKSALEAQALIAQEVSHRVKNSLQLVSNFLGLQRRNANDDALQSALADAETRVATVARLHDRLWRQDQVKTIDLADYLRELCDYLSQQSTGVVISTDLAPVTVETDKAVSIGLLLNEIVTNALKYAYPDGQGEVRISLSRGPDGVVELRVADDGCGLPDGFDPSSTRSLGMRIATTLAKQIGGEIDWKTKPGTTFRLRLETQA